MNRNESKYFNTALKMNDALVTLLEKKDFEYITIKDICAKAKVNRSTFYLHYSNTSDLLEEVIENLTKSFHEHFSETKEINISNQGKDLSELYLIKDEFLIPYLSFIKDNKRIYKAMKHQPTAFRTNRTYEYMFNTIFSPILSLYGIDKKIHAYIMDFYMNGLSSIIIDWVNDDCEIEIERMCDIIKGIIVKI